MDPFIIAQTIDLAGENPAKTYRQPLAAGDSAAHRWEVRVTRGGQAADLTGCTAAVLARREGEDSSPTVRQTAQIAGNVASAEFIPEVYALGGRLLAVMVISDASGRVVTLAALRMQGKQYTTDSISDPEGTIPSLDALLARYNDLVTATEAALAATQDAQAATEETQAALGDAQTALADAQQAVSAAQGALTTAQTAADTANAAAGKIDAMTVSATPVETGTATAALSTVDGHYHLALGLPKGNTGATPQISVQVQTGAAGSEASVSVSGTAEEPVILLTIPRGDTGRIENLTINGKPVESGTITLTAADVGAASAESVNQLKSDIDGLSDAIANAGGVKTVAGVGPDSAGNVALTAADVGALATSGTAADSSKLGGKTLAEIMLTLYPVGAVYISANSTSPASLLGGTWEQIHGRFLLASGSPNANTDNLFGAIIGGWSANSGSTGGQDYHTLTVDELPSHTHESQYVKPEAGYAAAGMMGSTEANWWSSDYIRATGGGQKHNNMPPYLAVNMWKRVS